MSPQKIEWHANRLLSKLNYIVHTDAVKNYIVPTLTEEQKRFVYAEEADVLNVALFGMTIKEWGEENPELAIPSSLIRKDMIACIGNKKRITQISYIL